MKKLLLAIALLGPLLLSAQTDPPPLVATGEYSNDFYQWSFTVGDLAIWTFEAPGSYWSQGSQQPVLTVVSTAAAESPAVQVALYPNPTVGVLFCNIQTAKPHEKIRFEIRTETGQVVRPWSTEMAVDQVFEIPVSGLAAGCFVVEFADQNGHCTSKKFIKN